jgi:histone H3/H4
MLAPEEECWMAGKKKSPKKAKEMLLVQSKVKEFIRGHEMMCATDLLESLNDYVCEVLERAVGRAQANGRKTARGYDI